MARNRAHVESARDGASLDRASLGATQDRASLGAARDRADRVLTARGFFDSRAKAQEAEDWRGPALPKQAGPLRKITCTCRFPRLPG